MVVHSNINQLVKFTIFFFSVSTAKTQIDQILRMHMLGHRSVFHFLLFYCKAQSRLQGCTCLATGSCFTYVLFYCKDPDQTVQMHMLGLRPIFHLRFFFFFFFKDQIRLRRYSCLDASLYFYYILFYSKDQTKLRGCTCLEADPYSSNILIYCIYPDQNARMYMLRGRL